MSTKNKMNKSSGLTLVEVLVVAPIVIIVIGIFISTIVYLTGDVISSRVSNNQSYMIQDALNRIEQDVKFSVQFLATNNITLTTPQGYSDDTTNFDNASTTTKPMLILNMFAISKPPVDESRNILYIPNTPNACTSMQVDQNTPLMFNIVYFVKNDSLVRRVIAPATYDDANGNCDPSTQTKVTPWQIPSCTTYNLGAFCKTADEVLVTGLVSTEGAIFKYFESGSIVELTQAGDTLATDAVRQTGLDLADMVTVTINTSITAAGRDVNDSGTMRATKYNLKE